jgi:hypothetical protein
LVGLRYSVGQTIGPPTVDNQLQRRTQTYNDILREVRSGDPSVNTALPVRYLLPFFIIIIIIIIYLLIYLFQVAQGPVTYHTNGLYFMFCHHKIVTNCGQDHGCPCGQAFSAETESVTFTHVCVYYVCT